jgi:hypothetical protein
MASKCPYAPGERDHTMAKRHNHPYTPPSVAIQRCTCGSRRWSVTTGGPLPPHVTCDRCGRENKTATAYERGRFHPVDVEPASGKPPF